MVLLEDIGIIGFLFFFIKGMIWIVLFLLVYFGWIKKERAQIFKDKIFFWRRKTTSGK
jgi:hypothetical protein